MYQPVTLDSSYWYYRISINMYDTFTDSFAPSPGKASLVSTVFVGDVFDNSTGIKVGTFQSAGVSTVLRADLTTLQYLATTGIELGPNGDDAIFTQVALDGANFAEKVADLDLAILGGTGQYKGATGDVRYTGTQVTKPDNLYVLEMAVPRFKRF
ncbi:hypothetical protein OEZ86_005736 [Tetradesmus obliquus]|nr:hypothetical protein OEZ86_005736 [Tetradesmus obliquus]